MSYRSKFLRVHIMAFAFGAAVLSARAFAYEFENAVPLIFTAALDAVSIERVTISLIGHDVVIGTELHNPSRVLQSIAFYANTPLFSQSGIGEEYLDKSFSNISVLVNGRPRHVRTMKRGFFMGQDITDLLLKAGLSPLPDIDADWKKVARLPKVQGIKPERWQGVVIHSWTDIVPPQSSALHQVRYRSMPQFAYEKLESLRFDNAVRQHCGMPEQVRRRIKNINPELEYALVERHDLQVPYAAARDIKVDVAHLNAQTAGALAAVSLICGLSNPEGTANFQGVIDRGAQSISVLVVYASKIVLSPQSSLTALKLKGALDGRKERP